MTADERQSPTWGGIEAGGTKFVCIVARSPEEVLEAGTIPTTQPDETLEQVISFFEQAMRRLPLRGVGIGSFGPLDLRKESATYGYITSTPKEGWAHVDLLGPVKAALDLPIELDTDVNAAALGEHLWGATTDVDCSVYLTIGTGIGGGLLVRGEPHHGLLHPEMGHMRIHHNWEVDPFPGSCPYHGDCLEGLASGVALRARYGRPPEEIEREHEAWEREAQYLAAGVANIICTLSPERIVLGGGIMRRPNLIEMVRRDVLALLNAYVDAAQILEETEEYLVLPALGDRSGVLGAIALAKRAFG